MVWEGGAARLLSIPSLASSPTLCRFESQAPKQIACDIHKVMVDHFIESQTKVPEELILDFDAADDLCMAIKLDDIFIGTTKTIVFCRFI